MAETQLGRAARPVRYEVHEVLGVDPMVDLGARFTGSTYDVALEFAFDYLQVEDPLRSGEVDGLEIVRVEGTSREKIWSYSHRDAGSVAVDLVSLWGFDPTCHWHGPPAYTRTP
ncbi:MAG: hypothetical protein WBB74_11515 [Gaiellaceae bacterium]